MTHVDLVVRGGQIVTAGEVACADIGITAGVVVQIGGELTADRELDATGKLVLPGGVDAHVHLSIPPSMREEPEWVDDFTSGSAAALAGGITTLGNMTFCEPGETLLAALERETTLASTQAIADFFLHPVLMEITPENLDQIPQLLDHGCNSLKFFMVAPQFDTHIQGYLQAIRRAGESELLTLIHCEDASLIDDVTVRLLAADHNSLRYYAQSRPVIAEVIATQRAVAFAEVTGAPVYIVHLSSARALEVCTAAQTHGLSVYVETRPLYLHMTDERYHEAEGAKYVAQPPLRTQHDMEVLWAGIQAGTIHTVCTDHAPWSLAAKLDSAHSLSHLRPGVENLQMLRPMLYSEGVRTGRISLRRFVEVTSTNAARLFGLYPRKGVIAVGSDADLVIFDPNLTRTVERDMLKSNADYSVYEGWEVTGWPILTLRRGEIVFRDNTVVGHAGSGLFVKRGPTVRL